MATIGEVKPKDEKTSANDEAKKTGRGRKAGVAPKERKDIPEDQFTIVTLSEEKRAEHKRRKEERKPKQKAVDKVVYDTYKLWVEAGRPTNWADMPVQNWPVAAEYEEDALFMLRKACLLYGRRLVLGQPPEDEIGITFCVVARPERKAKPKETEAPTE